MSYKVTTINNQAADSADNTNLSLSNVITVNNPTGGQFLKKTAIDWDTDNIDGDSIAGKFNLGRTGSYSGGTYYYVATHCYEWIRWKSDLYPAEPQFLQTVTGWCPVNNSNFRMRFYFLASIFQGKTVILEASVSPYSQGGVGLMELQWVNGYTNTYTPLGPKSVVRDRYADKVWGRYVNTGNNDTIALKVTYVNSNSVWRNSTGLTPNNEQITIRMY